MVSGAEIEMVKAAPPSPALSNSDMFHGLPSSFGELAQHNTVASYHRDQLAMDSFQTQSQPVSRYSTPVPQGMPYHHHMSYVGGHYVRKTPVPSSPW